MNLLFNSDSNDYGYDERSLSHRRSAGNGYKLPGIQTTSNIVKFSQAGFNFIKCIHNLRQFQ